MHSKVSALVVGYNNLKKFFEENKQDYPLVFTKKMSDSSKKEVNVCYRAISIKDILKNVKGSSEFNLNDSFNISYLEKCVHEYKINKNENEFMDRILSIDLDALKVKQMNTFDKISKGKFICHWSGSEYNLSDWEFFDKYEYVEYLNKIDGKKQECFSHKKFVKIISKDSMKKFKVFL